jgi:hypothetical protein
VITYDEPFTESATVVCVTTCETIKFAFPDSSTFELNDGSGRQDALEREEQELTFLSARFRVASALGSFDIYHYS